MPAARVVEVTVLGNTASLEAALERSGAVAASSSAKIKASYAEAGAAAAKAAEAAGASADEQAAAAGRAAAAQVDANARITRAQQVAADAAAKAAEAAGASADEQVAAARRAAAAQAELETQARATAVASTEAGFAIGDSFGRGADKAGGAITKLGSKLEGWGIPFAGGLVAVGKGLDDTDTKSQHLTKTMSALGGATLLGAGAAFAAVGAEGVHLAADFQKSVASIAANADIPVAAATKIGDAFLNTAGYMTISGNEMAKAFAPVAGQLKITEGAALSTAQSLSFMKTAADLAEGSQTDLTTSTAALSQVMQSFHLPLTQATTAADTLFNVSRSLNVPIDSVAQAVDKLHGRLGILMPSISDVSGLMIALGQHGIMGSRGIQVAQTALTKLTDGNQNTTTVLGELGVSITNSQGKFIGMAALIDELRPKLADLNQKSQEVALTTLFGSSAWEVMGQIIGAGVPKFNQATDAATKMGTAHKAATEQAKTLAGQIKILVASLEDMATKLGNVLIPVLNTLAGALSNTINWMEQHKAVAEALAGVISGVLGAAVLVFAEQKAVKFGQSIGNMVSDMGKLVSGIETGVAKIIAQFSAQDAAVESSSATMAEKSAAASGSVASEATAVTASTTTIDGDLAGVGAASTAMAAKVGTGTAAAEGEMATFATTAKSDAVAVDGSFAAMGAGATGLLAKLAPIVGAIGLSGVFGKSSVGQGSSIPQTGLSASGEYAAFLQKYPITHTAAQLKQFEQQYASSHGGSAVPVGTPLLAAGGGFNTPLTASSTQTTAQQLVQYLMSQGYDKNAAAGLAGNVFGGEDTAGRSNLDQGGATATTPTEGVGFGLAQWTDPGRQAALAAYAAAHGLPVDSIAAQEGFLAQEASGLKGTLNASPNAAAAALAAENLYESPGGTAKGATAYTPNANSSTQAREQLATQLAAQGGLSAAQLGPSSAAALQAAGVTSSGIPVGSGSLPTGSGNLPNPTIAAASQKTVDAINTAFTAAIDKYSAAAKSATSGPLKVIDAEAAAKIDELKASFDSKAAGLSGPALEALKTTTAQTLTAIEQQTAAQVKNESTFEAIRAALEKQEEKYKSAAQSATTPLLAKLNTTAEAELTALQSHFKSPSQDYSTKLAEASIEAQTKARVRVGTAAAGYSSSALTATSPLLAQLDEHFAELLDDIASGKSLPAAGVVGRIETRAKTQTALGGRAAAALGTGESNLNSSSYQTLASATDKIQKTAMDQLVKELDATHVSELSKLGTQLQTTFKQEETAKNNILVGDQKQEAAAATQKITMVWQDASDEAVQAIKDAAQGFQDAASAMAQSISDIAQQASDTATGTSTLIADQAQTTVDTLGERGLYGLNLIAQQMTVAADQQKTAFDAQINVLQQQADSVTTTQDALVAAAQQGLDNITQSQDAVVANATANLDAVTATQNAAITLAQAKVDQGVAGSQAALAAAQGTAAATEATAAQQLEQAQATASGMEAQANSALSGAQAAAATAVAQAQAALSNAQSAAQIAEAQSQAEIAIEKEEAATQFAGSGVNIYVSGINPTDAAAVASEVSWVARSQFTSPVA